MPSELGLPAARKSPGVPPTDSLHEKLDRALFEYLRLVADAEAEFLYQHIFLNLT